MGMEAQVERANVLITVTAEYRKLATRQPTNQLEEEKSISGARFVLEKRPSSLAETAATATASCSPSSPPVAGAF